MNKKISLTLSSGGARGLAHIGVIEVLLENNITTEVINIGVPDKFFNHATREEQLNESGISKENIINKIKNCIDNNNLYDVNHSSNIE